MASNRGPRWFGDKSIAENFHSKMVKDGTITVDHFIPYLSKYLGGFFLEEADNGRARIRIVFRDSSSTIWEFPKDFSKEGFQGFVDMLRKMEPGWGEISGGHLNIVGKAVGTFRLIKDPQDK